jgi:hypothetical protein
MPTTAAVARLTLPATRWCNATIAMAVTDPPTSASKPLIDQISRCRLAVILLDLVTRARKSQRFKLPGTSPGGCMVAWHSKALASVGFSLIGVGRAVGLGAMPGWCSAGALPRAGIWVASPAGLTALIPCQRLPCAGHTMRGPRSCHCWAVWHCVLYPHTPCNGQDTFGETPAMRPAAGLSWPSGLSLVP